MQIQCMQTCPDKGRDYSTTGQFKLRADDRKQLFKVRSHGIVRLQNRTMRDKSCRCKTSLQFSLRSAVVFICMPAF